MKLVISISDDSYDYIKGLARGYHDYATNCMLYHSVKNAVPYEDRPQGEWINDSDDLPICKKCRFCKRCMKNKKLPKITFEKGYPFIYCTRHHDHFSPYDTCEFFLRGGRE